MLENKEKKAPQQNKVHKKRNKNIRFPFVEDLPHDDGKAIHIGLLGVVLHTDNLRRDPRRSPARSHGDVVVLATRETEIADLGVEGGVDEDVAALEIALDDIHTLMEISMRDLV